MKGIAMSNKILFDWLKFSDVELSLSKTEKIVIREHFDIWLEGNPDDNEHSAPEMRAKLNQFKAAWIMSQMFTGNY